VFLQRKGTNRKGSGVKGGRLLNMYNSSKMMHRVMKSEKKKIRKGGNLEHRTPWSSSSATPKGWTGIERRNSP